MGEKEGIQSIKRRRKKMTAKFAIQDMLVRIDNVFTPQSPIKEKEFFIGRIDIIRDAQTIVERPGAHLILYGDRGVGKTSLATFLQIVFSMSEYAVFYVTCDSEDTFESLWRKVFKDLIIETDEDGEKQTHPAFPEEKYIRFGASEVVDVLKSIQLLSIVIFDEFDRLDGKKFNHRLFADTIKVISDNLPSRATLIIVGVGSNVNTLIGEHESIERNLVQMPLPLMSDDELKEIIIKGIAIS